MRKPSVGIAPEGVPFIILFAISTLTFAALRWWPVALLCLFLTWFCVYFFRDPERVIPDGEGLAVSPADGRIIRIEPRTEPFSGEQRMCISIFMNVFNVHVNRFPLNGVIERIQYYAGSFLNAAMDKASTENERCAYLITDEQGHKWTMVQIAGLVARRIVCRVEPKDALKRGDRYGLIRFGSRVDVYLPDNYAPQVYIGDKVIAGESVLARKNGNS